MSLTRPLVEFGVARSSDTADENRP